MMPFLSIIIPVYNKGKYLDKCLSSIVSQSFADWELIIVDDGSTDNSTSICERWRVKDPRITVIRQPNSGVSSARNKGLDLAHGQYVQFTDADDWWESGTLQALYDEIVSYGMPDILIFGMTKVMPDGTQISFTPRNQGKICKKDFFSLLMPEQTRQGVYGAACNKWLSLKVVKKFGLRFNRAYTLLEDYDFFLSAYCCCPSLALSHNTGYHYLQQADNSTALKAFRFHYPSVIAIHVKEYEFCREIGGESEQNKQIAESIINGLYLGMFTEMQDTSLANIKKSDEEVRHLIPGCIHLKPRGSTINTTIIAFLLNQMRLRLLSLYLSLRHKLHS